MSEFWYYAEGDETRGPITLDQLIKLLSQMPTPKEVLVWREGFTDWTVAGNVREILEKLIRPPPLRSKSSVTTPTGPSREEGREAVAQYQQQFRNDEPGSTEKKLPKKWSLWRAALYGFLLGIFTFVLSNTANDSWKDEMAWWQFGRPGQIIGYFGGRFLGTPLLFVLIAVIRNLFIRTKRS